MAENFIEQVKLGQLPKPAKWFITMFLVVMTVGYLMAVLNIWTSMEGIKESVKEVETPEGIKTIRETKINSLWIYKGVVNHYRGAAENASNEDKAAYPGMDLPTMVSTSHTHLIAMGMMVFCLGLIFLFTNTLPGWLKKFVLVDSFVAVIIVAGSFWFIKYIAPWGAYLMMFSGMLLGFCVFFETITPLYEMWVKKKNTPMAPLQWV